jgi:hypothetical protein
LALSGILFRKNYAQVASILFTEAAIFEPLNCTPVECEYNNTAHNNTARGSRALIATPPTHIAVNMSATMRSGAQLPLTLRLVDGCVRVVLCLRFNATLFAASALTHFSVSSSAAPNLQVSAGAQLLARHDGDAGNHGADDGQLALILPRWRG